MPSSLLHDRPVDRWLRKARVQFDALGRIPLDTATQLMQHGIVVQHLEDHWARLRK